MNKLVFIFKYANSVNDDLLDSPTFVYKWEKTVLKPFINNLLHCTKPWRIY